MTSEKSLLDEILPAYDVSSAYSTSVNATPEKIFHVLQSGIPTGSFTKILMFLRSIPRAFRPRSRLPVENAFYKLKQLNDREIVLGIAGQFWKSVAVIVPIESLEEFLAFETSGYCKAALNVRILPQDRTRSLLITETRVQCFGSARKQFLPYWKMIKPFSGIIRREILRNIKKKAEGS